ncbi:MAG TPA: hypothetical protein VLR52_04270 [Bacteroidales bacterium]|nr:hypothetical protein [Bacteroidales bacterium]
MKKGFILLAGVLLFSLSAISQNFPVYGIPSYGTLIEGPTLFKPTFHSVPTVGEGRRELHTTVTGTPSSSAIIIVRSLDGLDSKGPFVVMAGETLNVEIDDREWGVGVTSVYLVTVDIWYTN